MAPVQIRLILSVFAVLLCGALINVHFFQSDVRSRQVGKIAMTKSNIADIEVKVSSEKTGEERRWQSRLLRDGNMDKKAARQSRVGRELAKASQSQPEPLERVVALPKESQGDNASALPRVDGKVMVAVKHPAKASKLVRAVQRELTSRGYEPGPVDGIEGLMTRAAIMAFQHDGGHALSGRSTEGLLRQLVFGGASLSAIDTASDLGAKTRRRVTKTVQLKLKSLGYSRVSANGLMSDATRDAIKKFEKFSGLVPTGRISGRLVGKLSNNPKMRYGARM